MKPGTDTVMVERLAVLEACFMAREGVLLAYLYGSHARGTAGPLSDLGAFWCDGGYILSPATANG